MDNDDLDRIDEEEQRQRWDRAHGDTGPPLEEWSEETFPLGSVGLDWDPSTPEIDREMDDLNVLDVLGDDSPPEETSN